MCSRDYDKLSRSDQLNECKLTGSVHCTLSKLDHVHIAFIVHSPMQLQIQCNTDTILIMGSSQSVKCLKVDHNLVLNNACMIDPFRCKCLRMVEKWMVEPGVKKKYLTITIVHSLYLCNIHHLKVHTCTSLRRITFNCQSYTLTCSLIKKCIGIRWTCFATQDHKLRMTVYHD